MATPNQNKPNISKSNALKKKKKTTLKKKKNVTFKDANNNNKSNDQRNKKRKLAQSKSKSVANLTKNKKQITRKNNKKNGKKDKIKRAQTQVFKERVVDVNKEEIIRKTNTNTPPDFENLKKTWWPERNNRTFDKSGQTTMVIMDAVWQKVLNNKNSAKALDAKTYNIYRDRTVASDDYVSEENHIAKLNDVFGMRKAKAESKLGVFKYQEVSEESTKYFAGKSLAIKIRKNEIKEVDLDKKQKDQLATYNTYKSSTKTVEFLTQIRKRRKKPNHMREYVQDQITNSKAKKINKAKETSFYHFLNPKVKTDQEKKFWRIYVTSRPSSTYAVMGALVQKYMDKDNYVSNIKMGNPNDLRTRNESIVVYASTAEQADEVKKFLLAYQRQNPERFENFTPAFTLPASDAGGIAVAQSKNEESFGHSRADIIDDVAKDFKFKNSESANESRKRFYKEVDDAMDAKGINMYSSYKNKD